jgi:hypothetical protein
MGVALAGCGKGPAFNTGSTLTNPAPTAALSIAFQPAPPASVGLGLTTAVTAVVSNDPNDYGVDWSVTCASTDCGHVSLPHTNSGQANTYTPPTSFATGDQLAVNIVAFATAGHSKNIAASINVTGFLGNLNGTYVFQAQGSNGDSLNKGAVGPYRIAGVVTLDGNGGVTGGEQTFSDSFRSGTALISEGNYTLGADGRGTLNLITSDPSLGNKGSETFYLAYVSSSESLIAQADGTTETGAASAAGTMVPQGGTAALSGGYAFAVSGTGSAGAPVAFGGVFNVDQPNSGTISGNGSVADECSFSANSCSESAGPSGTVLPVPADTYGALQLTLKASFAANPVQLVFTGYAVDAAHIALIETDQTGFATSGIAIGQGSATGGFGAQSFSGLYVFGISGFDKDKAADSLASAGRLDADGAGDLQGVIDEFGRTGSPALSQLLNGAAYTADSTGRVQTSTGAGGPELLIYLTGNGDPALVLEFDSAASAVGSGIAYARASTSLQPGGYYGLNAFASLKAFAMANDLSGQMIMTQATDGLTATGLLDNWHINGTKMTGTFQTTSAGADYSGTIDVNSASARLPASMSVDVFLVDDNHGFLVETDSATAASAFLGYFAAQAPVCPSCQQ